MPARFGACLGPYEVPGPIGTRGAGDVYRDRDTRLGLTAAFRILGCGATLLAQALECATPYAGTPAASHRQSVVGGDPDPAVFQRAGFQRKVSCPQP